MIAKRIIYYISGHGFGHAVRSALVVRELYALGFRTDIISSAPKSIFDCNLHGVPYGYHYVESDAGVRQRGSLEIDLPGTLRGWRDCLTGEEKWIETQLGLFRKIKPVAVVGDIVPFAFPLARRAGLPSFLIATFSWDWILDFYKEEDHDFGEIAARLREHYLAADHLIYSPLSYGLPPIQSRNSISLMGKRSLFSHEELRSGMGLDARPAFLVSFGGFGFQDMGKLRLKEMEDFQFLFLSDKKIRDGNVMTFSSETAHEDLVAVSRSVITKPGYGISCEAILNRTPMIYTSRGKFAEYGPLVKDIKKYVPTSYISHEELFNGGLKSHLDHPPKFNGKYLEDSGKGAFEAAEIIVGNL